MMSEIATFYNSDDVMYNRLCEHAESVLSVCDIEYYHEYSPTKLRESVNTTSLYELIKYNSKGEQSIDEGVYITKQNFYMYLKKIFVGVHQTYRMKIFFKGEDVKEVEFFIKQILKQSKK
jgi:hypothetical protein